MASYKTSAWRFHDKDGITQFNEVYNSHSDTFVGISVFSVHSTSEMFLSVSFLFSSIFLSMPTIPTARVFPVYMTTKERKTHTVKPTFGTDKLETSHEGQAKINSEEGEYCGQLLLQCINPFR